jgi:outer membrane protein
VRRFNVFVLIIFILLIGICSAQEKLTLEKSVQIAFEKSPIMLKARADISAAEGQAGQVVAGFLPQLVLRGGIGKSYSEPMSVEMTMMGTTSVFSYGTDEQADTYNLSASISQFLFAGGKLPNSIGMAAKGVKIANEEFRRIVEDLKFNVIEAYYTVLKTKKYVELSQESVDMAKKHLNRIKALINAGMSTRADSLRGEVQVAQAEVGLIKAKQAYEISKNHFNNAIGRELDDRVELADIEFKTGDVPVYNYAEILILAYKNRPDWRQYVLAKQVSEDEVRIAYSDLFPMISLVGSYDTGVTRYSAYESDIKNWSAMISGSWNLFDGTATWNRIKEKRARLEAQKADEISIKKGIALEVKDANFILQGSIDNLAGTETALKLAEENFNIAELRYRSGVGTNLESIDAQVALTQARTENLQAQNDLQLAKARINKVIGREVYY